jgi:tRNA1Val (adenine37-N6)-methyltransferase
MANDWFRFKQFMIAQDKCAMKVSTDACIQGAYAARYLKQQAVPGKLWQVLDIGTGTGLLSLMIAQEVNAMIDAVEADAAASRQAAANFSNSDWHARLHAHHGNIKDYVPALQYDFIICNPPFFNNSLKNKNAGKTMARHDDTLPQALLAQLVRQLLQDEGRFCVMYPATEWQQWTHVAAEAGLQLIAQLSIKHKSGQPGNRQIGIFQKNIPEALYKEALVIYGADGNYAPPFVALMKAYYFNL